jgi:hypothetical protein
MRPASFIPREQSKHSTEFSQDRPEKITHLLGNISILLARQYEFPQYIPPICSDFAQDSGGFDKKNLKDRAVLCNMHKTFRAICDNLPLP